MTLKAYGPDTVMSYLPETRCINVHRNGPFTMNPATAKAMGIKEGMYVRLFQDEHNPGDWYLAVVKDSARGFKVRVKEDSKGTKRVVFQSMATARQLFASIEKPDLTSGTMLVGREFTLGMDGMDLYPIITSSLKVRAKRKLK